MTRLTIVGVVGCLMALAAGAPTAATAQEGLELSLVADPSQWSVEYELDRPKVESPSDPRRARIQERLRKAYPRMTSLTVRKSEGRVEEVYTYEDGSVSRNWRIGDLVVVSRRGGELTVIDTSEESSEAFKGDFHMFPWFAETESDGEANFEGERCLVYEFGHAPDRQARQRDDEKQPNTYWRRLYVERRTRLPRGIEGPGFQGRFTFSEGASPVEIPQAAAQKLTEYLELKDIAAQREKRRLENP